MPISFPDTQLSLLKKHLYFPFSEVDADKNLKECEFDFSSLVVQKLNQGKSKW